MTPHHAAGTFEVSVKPVGESSAEGTLGRMSLDKQFAGDLSGVGKGEMLTAMTQTKGSAGYVAIEQFTGTLHGRAGGFVFQHSGSMTRGAQQLSITVVSDSGTGQLAGITGNLEITIADGEHSYAFSYTLPP
ncbi:MAG: DUF3224 domain-containing protein [Casimicrobiaceae bacterium]